MKKVSLPSIGAVLVVDGDAGLGLELLDRRVGGLVLADVDVADPVRETERPAARGRRACAGTRARAGAGRLARGGRRRRSAAALRGRAAGGKERRGPRQGTALEETPAGDVPGERLAWRRHAVDLLLGRRGVDLRRRCLPSRWGPRRRSCGRVTRSAGPPHRGPRVPRAWRVPRSVRTRSAGRHRAPRPGTGCSRRCTRRRGRRPAAGCDRRASGRSRPARAGGSSRAARRR